MKKLMLTLSLTLISLLSFAQTTQTVRGVVRDNETKAPIFAALVTLQKADSTQPKAVQTDSLGNFKFAKVEIGRKRIRIMATGYKPRVIENVVLTTGKELVLEVDMEANPFMKNQVTISGSRGIEAINEMATVSARVFTVDETERYAGSRGDPARMASNYAGVQGADDSRNDIVVRGNSPQSVLWRFDGIDLPNPNHFAIAGTGGGPVSILNNKYLANSDFYTGAFPAEFGNTVAGVFDLRMRNGNNEKRESTMQFGFLGTELMTEGPLGKNKNASYLLGYRYSTLSIFKKLGIDIGTNAVPQYQDGSFRFNFKLKNNANLAFYGIGGMSEINILISDQIKPDRNVFGDNDRDQYFRTKMGFTGATYTKSINKKTFFKWNMALSTEIQQANHNLVKRHLEYSPTLNDSVFKVDALINVLGYNFKQSKYSNSLTWNTRLSAKSVIRYGVLVDAFFWNYVDSGANLNPYDTANYLKFRMRWNTQTTGLMVQPFIQWKLNLTEKLTMNVGWHMQYFSLTKSLGMIQPRLGLKYTLPKRQQLSFGAGVHTQTQPMYTYFYGKENDAAGNPLLHNKNLDFTKAAHAVLGYDKMVGKHMHVKMEAYYQYLWNVPVEKRLSSFSLVNTGTGFSRFFPDTLENKGIAWNYGVEATVERSFAKGYYFLATGSLFQSKYKGSDGVTRNTDFNGQYAWNLLFSKEFRIKSNQTFSVGAKLTRLGGRWYGPADPLLSAQAKEVVPIDSLRNSLRFPAYFRFDVKLNYKINTKKVTHEFAVDLVNLLNTKNVLKLTWAPDDPSALNGIRQEYQLGFLPLFYYKLDF